MPTSVHIPKDLLVAVDRKAKALKISRNRFIIRALEKEMAQVSDWSPGFLERLSTMEPGAANAVDDMLAGINKARRSKKPIRF